MKFFEQAKPVWPKGLETEKNMHAGFSAEFQTLEDELVVLRLTGSTLYRVMLNGEFIHHGPARGPHGFFRVDELELEERVKAGANILTIEVAGYNCNSFAYPNQPSFCQAEILVSGQVVAATGNATFAGAALSARIQKVERYGFQRPFLEAYRLPGLQKDVELAVQEDKTLLPRNVAVPDYDIVPARQRIDYGVVELCGRPVDRSGFWWMRDEHYNVLKSFHPDQFELDVLRVHQSCECYLSGATSGNRYELWDLGVNLTGFIRCKVTCAMPIRLMVLFDEVLANGDIDLSRNDCLSLVYYELLPGEHELESIEPYTGRYLKVVVLGGNAQVRGVGMREFANPEADSATFECSDPDFNRLFEAGRQTFRQNAVDIYMDCPGRERAGWLCDSFFTGRVEPLLCGSSRVERNFIENFALPDSFARIPKGMLPMCYPADTSDGRYIPQWSLWLILEAEEYLQRTGDRELIDQLYPRFAALFDFFKPFENEDGLLEKLPSWNFIEWSKANELINDVNYPTNMLYAKALDVAARLYAKPEWGEKSGVIHETVRGQSFNGTFFVDNAVRDENRLLVSSGECTEVCQYYAFFCGTASQENFSNLWNFLLEEAGPNRSETNPLHPANAFIGYFLRMELLSLYGEGPQLLREIKAFFLPMADKTGTLWEHRDVRASCNHGFASYLCVLLDRHKNEISEKSKNNQRKSAGCSLKPSPSREVC
jgi:alpha-L-rhamnosidase